MRSKRRAGGDAAAEDVQCGDDAGLDGTCILEHRDMISVERDGCQAAGKTRSCWCHQSTWSGRTTQGRRGKSDGDPDALASVADAGEGGEVRRRETRTSSLLSKPRAGSSPQGDTGSSPRYSGCMRCRRWVSPGWRPAKLRALVASICFFAHAGASDHAHGLECAAPTMRSVNHLLDALLWRIWSGQCCWCTKT